MQELNLRPSPCKGDALTTELMNQMRETGIEPVSLSALGPKPSSLTTRTFTLECAVQDSNLRVFQH